MGLSVPQVLANELAYESIGNIATEDAVYGLTRHFIATARYDFQLTDELSFEPIAMVRATPGAPTQIDVNAMFNYDDRFWLGGMYRSEYAATFSAAALLFNQIVAGYSYDLAVNTNKQFLRGAHEVMLGFQFGDRGETKKLFKDLGDKVKKNEDNIKKNRDDVDQNDKDIDDLIDEDKDLEEDNKRLEEQLKELRLEFDDFKKSIDDGSLQAGDIFSFNNVYFETNKSDLRGTDISELDNLVIILNNNPTMTVAIMGHTDLRGSVAFNERLSRDRSESVRQYLVGKGISPSRLDLQSFGESLPVSEDLQQNRRVEFKVLTK
ncbi:type IX secretion system membrane protein PorP/SprF [Bacteroidia bacterium]|nr:type IX secretion system membrane protein PorP/SprF [Bacteroidia bacterium]